LVGEGKTLVSNKGAILVKEKAVGQERKNMSDGTTLAGQNKE
jgi:hypothetical protein